MLSLGPLGYDIDPDVLPVELQKFYSNFNMLNHRVVRVLPPDARADDATPTLRASIARRSDHDVIFASLDAPRRGVMDALCTLVALDAPAYGCVLVHAAAITSARGVTLLTGPPGVGKSTAARHASSRAFAYNSVLLRTDGACWPMPFAGGDGDPEVPDREPRVARVLAELVRAEEPSVEWLTGARATVVLTRACVRPLGRDSSGEPRARCILSLTERLISLRLGVTRDPTYLAALDAALKEDQ